MAIEALPSRLQDFLPVKLPRVEALLAAATLLLSACSSAGTLAWDSLDQASRWSSKRIGVNEIEVPAGFRAVRVVAGLNYPSALTWDRDGALYVLESHTVPVPLLRTKIVRIGSDGRMSKLRMRGAPPNTGIAIGLTHHDGWLYFSHEEKDATFTIYRVRPQGGNVEAVLRNLPSEGDHDLNHLAFDAQGTLHFGIGSATNSGVVSAQDPVNQKWLKAHPSTADVPCRDVVLNGQMFRNENNGQTAVTGAYQPYGQSGARSIAGKIPCMSAIFRLRAGATAPKLVAWGFRNPVALAFDNGGNLYVGMQGADIRSTRPVLDDPDAVYRVREGAWYGWPDYSAALLPLTDPRYRPPGTPPLQFVMDHQASGLPAPDRSLLIAATKPHAAVSGMAFHSGRLLLAEMGDFKPLTDSVKPEERAGFQVEQLDPRTGMLTIYARNRGPGPSLPASMLDHRNALERPVDVRVGPDGLIYILDFGVFDTRGQKPGVMPKTGKVFRIEPVGN
jgi:glucose/arabinose dehydrogenase